MAQLFVSNGSEAGRQYDLSRPEVILGRLNDCHIIINVGAVSRHHARLIRDGDRFFIEDLKSRNGTLLNNELIKDRMPLRHGDKIKICDVEFLYHDDIPPTTPKPSTPTITKAPGVTVEIFEPLAGGSSTVMGKLDLSSGRMPVQVSSSPEVRLRAILEISQAMGKTLGLDDVLAKILQSCFKLFTQADRGLIVLKSPDGALIPKWTKTRRANQEDTIRISRTIVNKVIESKEAILLADAANDSQFAMSQSVADLRLRSAMCAPLIDSSGQAFGVLQIDTADQRGRFKDDDLEILVSVAAIAAIAIDNAQLYEKRIEQQAMERDLKLASDVQKSFLPSSYPDLGGYEFFHYYEPAVYIGGDYFDYIRLTDGRLAVVVADVAGHGVPAALLMAKLSAEARYCLVAEPDAALAITMLNERLTALDVGRFITLILIVIDPRTHEMTVVSAGHMAPIVRRANAQIEEPGSQHGGPLLGVIGGVDYTKETIQLNVGDVVVLYTDGINESCNSKGDQYTIERLSKLIGGKAQTAESIGQMIVRDVRDHLGNLPQDDDMCVVCVARTGPA